MLDESGNVHAVDLESRSVPEAYRDVSSWSRITAAVRVTVAAGQTVTAVDFTLPVGFTVSGCLVDGQGAARGCSSRHL